MYTKSSAVNAHVAMTLLALLVFVTLRCCTVDGQLVEEEIDEFINTALNCTDVPGATVTIIRDAQVRSIYM